jgi:hypothetical protein
VLETPENLFLAEKLSSDLAQAAPPPTQSSPPLSPYDNWLAKRCLPQPASTERYLPRSGENVSRQKKKEIDTEGDGHV